MDQLLLLDILSDGRFHSGGDLGEALGVSRAAVWKAIRNLQALELDIHSVKGKGHRLACPLELLRRDAILAQLDEERRRGIQGLELLLSVDSTNTLLLRRIQSRELLLEKGRLHVCLAERQTAGKGRRGREWVSPFGRNMYLSVGRQFSSGAGGLDGLSLVVAIGLVRALRQCAIEGLVLKWPNDVFCQGRKLAGILLEMTGDVTGDCQVVIGVGLNISSPPGAMKDVSQPWIDLQSIAPVPPGRNRVVGLVLRHLGEALDEFERSGFAGFRAEWESLDGCRDRPVEISSAGTGAGEALAGIARGVTEQGALRLETPEGMRIFNGGEVSMKPRDAS